MTKITKQELNQMIKEEVRRQTSRNRRINEDTTTKEHEDSIIQQLKQYSGFNYKIKNYTATNIYDAISNCLDEYDTYKNNDGYNDFNTWVPTYILEGIQQMNTLYNGIINFINHDNAGYLFKDYTTRSKFNNNAFLLYDDNSGAFICIIPILFKDINGDDKICEVGIGTSCQTFICDKNNYYPTDTNPNDWDISAEGAANSEEISETMRECFDYMRENNLIE